MSKKHSKKYLTSIVIMEIQIKMALHRSEWLISKTQVIVHSGRALEKKEHSIAGGIADCLSIWKSACRRIKMDP